MFQPTEQAAGPRQCLHLPYALLQTIQSLVVVSIEPDEIKAYLLPFPASHLTLCLAPRRPPVPHTLSVLVASCLLEAAEI